jgi:hypothetical protein
MGRFKMTGRMSKEEALFYSVVASGGGQQSLDCSDITPTLAYVASWSSSLRVWHLHMAFFVHLCLSSHTDASFLEL